LNAYATQYTFNFAPIELYYADAALLDTSTGTYMNGIVPVDSGSAISGTFTVNINNNFPTLASYNINISASTVASPAYSSGGSFFGGAPWPNRAPYSIPATNYTNTNGYGTTLAGQAGWHGPSFTYGNGYVFDPFARPSTDIPYRVNFYPINTTGPMISLWFSTYSTSELLFGRYPYLSSYGWMENTTTNPVGIIGFLGPKGAFAGSGLVSSPINTTGSGMESTNLGSSLDADFQGGTLSVQASAATISQNFNVGNIAGNTVDANGNTTILSGTLTGTGGLKFTDSSGAANTITLTNSGGNTFSGTTTVNGTTLLAGAANVLSPNSAVQLDNVAQTLLDLNGFNQTINGLSGGGANGGNISLGGATLTNNGGGTYEGVISGNGAYVQGGGTQIFSGDHTYTGGTTITGGSLQIGNGGTSGSILGNVTNNGIFAFNRSDAMTFAALISGTGSVQQNGSGTLIFTNDHTYTGGTTITGGTLQIGTGGTTGSILGDVTNNGILAFNRSDATTFSGLISGAGSLQKNGAGTLILTGDNTYTGSTTISIGTLQVGNGGATGAVAGNVMNNGVLIINRSGALTIAGMVSGNGSLLLNGSGTISLNSANSYTGATTVSSGTLALTGSGSISSSSGITMSGAGAFDISGTSSGTTITSISGSSTATTGINLGGKTLTISNAIGTYSGAIAGTGGLILTAGSQTLSGSNTFSGGVEVQAGAALTINAAAALGSGDIRLIGTPTTAAVLTITANANIANNVYVSGDPVFNIAGGTTTTVSSVIADAPALPAGDVVLNNDGTSTGTLILTANNTYTGGTIITAGTLQLGNGGTSGSVIGDITNNGTLIFNRSDAITFANVISGTGAVKQNGTGTLTLSNANTYTGSTTITSGTLALSSSGSIASSTSVTNNGIFDLRSAANTVSLAGAYTQGSTGTLKMVMGVGSSQLLSTGGAVTLDGALNITASAGTYTKKHYHLITGTSVAGKFSSFTSNLASYTNLLYGLSYTASGVDLVVGLSDAANSLKALTANGNQVRNALTQRTSAITGTMDYDCRDFSEQNLCLSFQARYTGFDSMSDGAGLLTIAKRVDDNVRVGGFIDQRVTQGQQTGVRLSGDMPTFGAFVGYSQQSNGTGLQAKLAASTNTGKITATRNGSLPSTEPGFGKSNLNSWAIGGEFGYGVALIDKTIVTPYVGLRYSDATRGAYSEIATSDVTEPVSYADYYQRQTTTTAGVRFAGQLTDTIGYQLGVGAEFDVLRHANHYAGTSAISGLESFSINTNTTTNRARTNASAGLSYAIDKNQKLTTSVSVRQQAQSSQPSLNTMAGYQISF
jgi:autotransporter-associated beta strand protein